VPFSMMKLNQIKSYGTQDLKHKYELSWAGTE
jgi:hypothetical protein